MGQIGKSSTDVWWKPFGTQVAQIDGVQMVKDSVD